MNRGKNATNSWDVPIGPTWFALLDTIERLRPWDDERSTERALRAWAKRYALPPLSGDAFADVAGALRAHGRKPGRADAGAVAYHALRNIAAGRDVDDRAMAAGWAAARTVRWYRRKYGSDVAAARALWERAGRKNALLTLIEAGRSPAAARRWVERHPGAQATDAPAPRRVR